MHPLFSLRDTARTALRIGDEAVSYHDLLHAARASAAHLLAQGLRRGDRVAIWATPGPATIAALLGNALAGLVSVPLNPRIGKGELAHILEDARPRLIVAADPAPFAAALPAGRRVDRIVTSGGGQAALPPIREDDPLLILYTSGTTGAPKGAVLGVGNAASNLDALAAAWGWSEGDTLVHALPLFHVHGLVLGVFGSLRVGSELVLLPRFSPEAVAAAFGEGGGTMLFGVPTMYHRLADHLEGDRGARDRLAAARLLISGSAALPLREHERLAALLGRGPVERYGLTETLINCSMRHDEPRQPGAVGRPLEGIELRLVDDQRRPLEPDDPEAIGEVAIRGPNVFAGYLNRPEATAEVVDAEGFFYTGDLATREPDGAVRIIGRRATDLIKTGGYKVGAGEVEGALLEHPQVAEAAVLGVADEDLGERIVAWVVPRPGQAPAPEALVDHVAGLLAPHKRPREVRLVDALPRNAMGKVMKARLRSAGG